jgi:tetratricopeptide (TPR) repeat protein
MRRGLGARAGLAALLVVIAGLTLPRAARADVTVKAVLDRAQVAVGEGTDLGVEVQGAQSTGMPEVANPSGATVSYLGPASRVSFVNGRMTASVTHHFSVSASKAGHVTLGPITVTVDGKRYDAGSVTLDVVANTPGQGAGNQLRLELSAPRTTVYVRERLPIRVKLMVGNVRVSDVQYPTIGGDGFAIDKLSEPDQRQEQTAEGTFQVLDFATVLTPLRSGTMTVGPAEMGLSMMVRGRGGGRGFDRFFNDPFFNSEQRRLEVTSDPLPLTVLPLPEAGKPADFSGAVGVFDFEVNAAPLDVAAGDPVTLTLTMRGTGSLENVSSPTVPAGDGLRVYPAQQTGAGSKPSAAANVQERTFEQVVIPERAGTIDLPALRFSYFDPTAGAYKTATHPPIPLVVAPRAAGNAPSHVVGAAAPAPEPKAESLGHDLVFIKDAPGTLRPVGARLHRSIVFWGLQVVPLLAWLTATMLDRRRRRLHGDAGYARFTRAGREARRALSEAKGALRPGNHAPFYDTVTRALTGYLAAKLQLPPGAVTAENVADHLARRGVAAAVVNQLRELFAHCEQVRFAPTAATDGDMQRTLEQADGIIRALERERRLGTPLAAMLALGCAATLLATGSAAAASTPGDDTPQTLFFRGNALYGDAHYADAVATYEKMLAAGYESGNLYFNLGNAYFKIGDVGRAILEYERARRLIPRDPDLHANLGYAREKSGDGDPTPLWARLVFPLAMRASSDELLAAASGCFVLLMTFLVILRFGSVPFVRAVAMVAAIGLVVTAGSAAYRLATIDLPTFAVVVAGAEIDVRFEPSTAGTAHFATKPGTVLRVLGDREGWAQVARPDGKRGWIPRQAIATL